LYTVSVPSLFPFAAKDQKSSNLSSFFFWFFFLECWALDRTVQWTGRVTGFDRFLSSRADSHRSNCMTNLMISSNRIPHRFTVGPIGLTGSIRFLKLCFLVILSSMTLMKVMLLWQDWFDYKKNASHWISVRFSCHSGDLVLLGNNVHKKRDFNRDLFKIYP